MRLLALACAWLLLGACAGAGGSSAVSSGQQTAGGSAPPAGGAAPAVPPGGGGKGHGGSADAAVERLFVELDTNQDNQITAEEIALSAAAAGLDWDAEGWTRQRAAAAGAAALDGADAGTTVSRQELQAHLRALLQVGGTWPCRALAQRNRRPPAGPPLHACSARRCFLLACRPSSEPPPP